MYINPYSKLKNSISFVWGHWKTFMRRRPCYQMRYTNERSHLTEVGHKNMLRAYEALYSEV